MDWDLSPEPCIYFLNFLDKATEHLLGEGIEPKQLNDDKIGRVMDKLYQLDVSGIFLLISLAAVKNFGVATENCHLDSTSLSVEGEYIAVCSRMRYTATSYKSV